MTDLQIILPRVPSGQEIRIKSHYEIWKREKEAREPHFRYENIHFHHDPYWRERYFSLASVRAVNERTCPAVGPTILWNTVKVVFLASQAAPYIVRMF